MKQNLRNQPAVPEARVPLLEDTELFRQVIAPAQLQAGWRKVLGNAGAAGGDGMSVDMFAVNATARISRLHTTLRKGSYRPGLVRIVQIPKTSGRGLRKLSIPCVADRVVQTAAAQVLTPLLDEEFEDGSFGYRPGRSVKQAVVRIQEARQSGFGWVVDADIENYFDQIPHDQLMERWGRSCTSGPLTELIWTWITQAAVGGYGVAQGSPLSPLLANLYLDQLDETFSTRESRIVRFADDFVILCRSEAGAEGAMDRTEKLLAEQGLSLNREKSRILSFDRGLKFLGHLFVRSMVLKVAPETEDVGVAEEFLRKLALSDEKLAAKTTLQQEETERRRELGYSPGLRNLYVLQKDRRLSIRNQAFVVEQGYGNRDEAPEWRELIAIPHQDVDRIDLGPGISATDEAIRHALSTDTSIAYVNGHGATLGWAAAALAPRAARHLAQAKTVLDADRALDLARIFVDARLRNQRAVLRRLLGGRPDTEKPQVVLDAIVVLNTIIGRRETSRLVHAETVSELMGYEGQAAAQWWKAVSALAHRDLAFAGIRRPDIPGRANICLDMLAWLLHRDISVAVAKAGLHPGFGVLHAVSNSRDAAVYDLMEEFRAHLIGGLFVYCTNKRLIRREMFSYAQGNLRLRNTGAEALIHAYERRANSLVKSPRTGKRLTWRRLMVEQVTALAAHMEGDLVYCPYIMDY